MKPSIHFLLLPSGTASGSSYGPPEICCLLSQLCKGSEGPDSGTVRGLLASGGPRPGQPTGLPLWGFPVDSLAPLSLHDANTEKQTSEHPGGQTFVQGKTKASGEMLSTFPLSGEALREVCTTWGSRSTDQASQNTHLHHLSLLVSLPLGFLFPGIQFPNKRGACKSPAWDSSQWGIQSGPQHNPPELHGWRLECPHYSRLPKCSPVASPRGVSGSDTGFLLEHGHGASEQAEDDPRPLTSDLQPLTSEGMAESLDPFWRRAGPPIQLIP